MTHPIQRPRGLPSVVAVALLMLAAPVGNAVGADIYTYTGPDRASRILDGARKEGKVVFYSAMIVNQALRPVGDAFQAKYPGVGFEFFRGDSRELIQKVMVEQRAAKPLADVVESEGIAAPTMKAGAVVPFLSPEAAPYLAQHKDAGNHYVAVRLSYFGMAYNTRTHNEGTVPKTYAELADPKYKDKLAWRAQSDSGSHLFISAMLRHLGDKDGEAYLKALSANKVVNYTGSARALVDRVGQGEYDFALNIFAHHPLISKAIGAPLDVRMMDPIPSLASGVVAIKNAPHPHAAMLLIDFLLSKEAQTILQGADYFPPHPAVEPDAKLAKILPRNAKMAEAAFSSQEIFDYTPKAEEMYDRYFK